MQAIKNHKQGHGNKWLIEPVPGYVRILTIPEQALYVLDSMRVNPDYYMCYLGNNYVSRITTNIIVHRDIYDNVASGKWVEAITGIRRAPSTARIIRYTVHILKPRKPLRRIKAKILIIYIRGTELEPMITPAAYTLEPIDPIDTALCTLVLREKHGDPYELLEIYLCQPRIPLTLELLGETTQRIPL